MKRKVNQVLTIFSGIFLLVLIGSGVAIYLFFPQLLHPEQKEAEKSLFAMDTYINLTAYGKDSEPALDAATDRLAELEQLWSVTDSESDIYAVNHSSGQRVSVDPLTAELLSFSLQMAEKTGGSLDPTIYPVLTAWGFTTGKNQIPADSEITALLHNVDYRKVQLAGNDVQLENGMMLDLGAVGKGYAGDLLAQTLRENGVKSALLDIGGNVQAIGDKPDGSPWRLGLRDPFSEGTLGILEVSDKAVVTSGNYERYFIGADGKQYGHIIDPATGYPADSGLLSVTVIAQEGKLCDALSTALFVMGLDKAAAYWQQNQNFDMILVTEDGELYLTPGIAEHFTLDSYHSNMALHTIQYDD